MHRCRKSSAYVRIVAAAAICWTLSVPAAHAGEVAIADLQATVRSLGFLDSLQIRSTVSIGVVYSSNMRDGKNVAAQTANAFAAMHGPSSSAIHANIVTVDELLQNSQRFDVLYLMPGVAASGAQIADFVRRQHVVSISSDPACLDAKCCVLMVQAGSNVNIVLDTAMASAANAHFSSVFTMMVKRK
ncbi:MAG: hypothetical protein WCA81_14150 [Rhizomicrobium sp.]